MAEHRTVRIQLFLEPTLAKEFAKMAAGENLPLSAMIRTLVLKEMKDRDLIDEGMLMKIIA